MAGSSTATKGKVLTRRHFVVGVVVAVRQVQGLLERPGPVVAEIARLLVLAAVFIKTVFLRR